MSTNKLIILLFTGVLLVSCNNTEDAKGEKKEVAQPTKERAKADIVLDETINAHGGDLYHNANFSFIFRKKKYSFTHKKEGYTYHLQYEKEGSSIENELTNGVLTQKIDGEVNTLSEKETKSISNSINSVIYFATLPYKLNDPAVNKAYKGTTEIKGESYDILKITFDENGGGDDHDDEYYYWINSVTKKIDYLAYNYQVNNGGVRFRSAYHQRVVDGITFQDYINYKAPVGTPLADLPSLYERDQLEELSRIETESVINLK